MGERRFAFSAGRGIFAGDRRGVLDAAALSFDDFDIGAVEEFSDFDPVISAFGIEAGGAVLRHGSAVGVVFFVDPALAGLLDVITGFTFVVGDVFLLPGVAGCGGISLVDALSVEAFAFASGDVEGAQGCVAVAQDHAACVVGGGFTCVESRVGASAARIDLDALAVVDRFRRGPGAVSEVMVGDGTGGQGLRAQGLIGGVSVFAASDIGYVVGFHIDDALIFDDDTAVCREGGARSDEVAHSAHFSLA